MIKNENKNEVNTGTYPKNIATLLCSLFIVMFFITLSCEPEYPVVPPIVDSPQEEPLNLAGTTWKLAAYVNVETGMEILPLPDSAECPTCYSFTFNTDSTAKGYSVSNQMVMYLKPVLTIREVTLIFEVIGNVALFYKACESLISCALEDDQLKFFYNDKKDYMLFRKQ